MNTRPTLPQNDDDAVRAARQAELEARREVYDWNRDTSIAPLGIPTVVPRDQRFQPVLLGQLMVKLVAQVENLLSAASRLFDGDTLVLSGVLSATDAKTLLRALAVARRIQTEFVSLMPNLQGQFIDLELDEDDADGVIENAIEWLLEWAASRMLRRVLLLLSGGRLRRAARDQALELTTDLVGLLHSDDARPLFTALGVWGRAERIYDYAEQFRTIDLPHTASVVFEDRTFARMRLAGPNPARIRRLVSLSPRFPVTEDDFQRGGERRGDTLDRALDEGRLYLLDFPELDGAKLGSVHSGPKYAEASMSLYVVDASTRHFLPVAIQLGQQPGPGTPIFTPADGAAWVAARIHVQAADGVTHESIAHLGLTHLLIGQIQVATERQLHLDHPVGRLLRPHFIGTLAINKGAVDVLVEPGGFVDTLLATEVSESGRLAVEAVLGCNVRDAYLPADLARRRVDDAEALPDYPYRDDGLLIWGAIRDWVRDYLAIYYPDDGSVTGDPELQAWRDALESPHGAHLTGVGPLDTLADLGDLLTFILFTASAQHAAVNFPQREIMSVTPLMPLAAYAPAPTAVDLEADVEQTALAHLPPLEQAFLQLIVTQALGSAYYTRLGDYDRNRRSTTFTDPRVAAPLRAFQQRLKAIEFEIGRRNLDRIPYTTLLPTKIPQSINI